MHAIVNVFLAVIAEQPAAIADPETIRHTAREVVRRPEFQLENPADSGRSLLETLLLYVFRQIGSLMDLVAKLWERSPVLAGITVIVLTVILVALMAHIFYTFKAALARRNQSRGRGKLDQARQDPRVFEVDATEAARRGDYITAIRMLFRACLLRLEQVEKRTPRPGTTNHELLRRHQRSSFYGALGQFVSVIDAKWYGHERCSQLDYEACLKAHAQITGFGLELR